MKSRFISLVAISFLFLCAISMAATQGRGPSTPEERSKAVQFAHNLESNPLGPQAKDERERLTRWLIEIPDITVDVCPRLLGSKLPERKNYGHEILAQLMYSEMAFMIENPDKAKDAVAVHSAGVNGSLRVYEVILKDHPKAKSQALDEIVARRDKQELKDFVQESLTYCTKRVS